MSHAGQAVPENCSAITETILHEVSSGERDNKLINRVPWGVARFISFNKFNGYKII